MKDKREVITNGDWSAMFGCKDGKTEVLAFGRFSVDESALQYYGCETIYHKSPDEMTDEEIEIAYAAYEDFLNMLAKYC